MIHEYKIYYLVDPRDDEFHPRYVGITKRNIDLRLTEHIRDAQKEGATRYGMRWVNSILKEGFTPVTNLLETINCTYDEAVKRESWYVVQFLKSGYNITNALKENRRATRNYAKNKEIPILALHRYTGEIYKEYESSLECCKDLNLSTGFVSSCLTGRKKTSQNYVLVKKSEYDPTKNYIIPEFDFSEHQRNKYEAKREQLIKGSIEANSVSIDQFDREGNFIKTWSSQTEASRQLKLQQANIHKVCVGKRTHTGGFVFKYSNK